MRWALIAIVVLLVGCAAPAVNGVSRPTLFTAPPGYLDAFPLGATAADVVNMLGAPDSTVTVAGSDHWTYRLSDHVGYTYELREGRVVDVRYRAPGPYNAMSARERQAE